MHPRIARRHIVRPHLALALVGMVAACATEAEVSTFEQHDTGDMPDAAPSDTGGATYGGGDAAGGTEEVAVAATECEVDFTAVDGEGMVGGVAKQISNVRVGNAVFEMYPPALGNLVSTSCTDIPWSFFGIDLGIGTKDYVCQRGDKMKLRFAPDWDGNCWTTMWFYLVEVQSSFPSNTVWPSRLYYYGDLFRPEHEGNYTYRKGDGNWFEINVHWIKPAAAAAAAVGAEVQFD